eukprot:6173465-Pleurochrysis_carterae.AAC.4
MSRSLPTKAVLAETRALPGLTCAHARKDDSPRTSTPLQGLAVANFDDAALGYKANHSRSPLWRVCLRLVLKQSKSKARKSQKCGLLDIDCYEKVVPDSKVGPVPGRGRIGLIVACCAALAKASATDMLDYNDLRIQASQHRIIY